MRFLFWAYHNKACQTALRFDLIYLRQAFVFEVFNFNFFSTHILDKRLLFYTHLITISRVFSTDILRMFSKPVCC